MTRSSKRPPRVNGAGRTPTPTGTPSPGVLAALFALADADGLPVIQVVLGGHVEKANVAAGGRGRGQRGSRYIGPAAIAVPAIRSLTQREWAVWVPRDDGLCGSAYVITDKGRAAAAALRAEQ